MLALLAILGVFSAYLAMNRIYQVDECQNVFMARIIGTGQSANYFTNAPLWLIGPLAWLARSARESTELFMWNRWIFLGIFWLNIGLVALATGTRLRSRRGLFILLMAATLAPLWDYGFEIRHDNLILTALLLTWWLGRTRPRGLSSYFLIGVLAVMLQFVAFKSFVYVLPLSAVFLFFPPPGHRKTRLQLAAAWVAGALVALVFCRLAYGFSGLWQVQRVGLGGSFGVSVATTRFSPWITFQRLLAQTPLLLAGSLAAFWSMGQEVRRDWRSILNWEGHAPECLLALIALGGLLVNPTPFPYNLINTVPFLFLLGCRFSIPFLENLYRQPKWVAAALGLLVFTHAVPFTTNTWRHLDRTNERQEQLMRVAEALTDAHRDRVYDAIGMVPTRLSVHFRWFLHSLNIRSFRDGAGPGIQDILAANPPAVIVPSYRTDWLRKEDLAFIQSRYVPLADDFWVLGQTLPSGGGIYRVTHPGRYNLLGQREGTISPLMTTRIDGQPLVSAIAELGLGTHTLQCAQDTKPIIVWLGPKLSSLPELGEGDHRYLFANWY